MAETNSKKMNYSVFLPPEMVEKILVLLNYKEICQAKLVCKRWKGIIDKGNLLKKASGKNLEMIHALLCLIDSNQVCSMLMYIFTNAIFFILRKNFLHNCK